MSKIHLLVEYYTIDVPDRQAELDYCLIHNIQNKNIDFVHIFGPIVGDTSDYGSNVIINYNEQRFTYNDYFEYSLTIPDDDIVIISNLDIYFDNTLKLVDQYLTSEDVFALTRWDDTGEGNTITNGEFVPYYNAATSQDTWIFRSRIKPMNRTECDYTLGVPACDNRIAYEFANAGYIVSNPCVDVKIYHNHKTNIRFYNRDGFLPGRCLKLPPIKLQDKPDEKSFNIPAWKIR